MIGCKVDTVPRVVALACHFWPLWSSHGDNSCPDDKMCHSSKINEDLFDRYEGSMLGLALGDGLEELGRELYRASMG